MKLNTLLLVDRLNYGKMCCYFRLSPHGLRNCDQYFLLTRYCINEDFENGCDRFTLRYAREYVDHHINSILKQLRYTELFNFGIEI